MIYWKKIDSNSSKSISTWRKNFNNSIVLARQDPIWQQMSHWFLTLKNGQAVLASSSSLALSSIQFRTYFYSYSRNLKSQSSWWIIWEIHSNFQKICLISTCPWKTSLLRVPSSSFTKQCQGLKKPEAKNNSNFCCLQHILNATSILYQFSHPIFDQYESITV